MTQGKEQLNAKLRGHYHITSPWPDRKWWQFWRSKPILVQGTLSDNKNWNKCPSSEHFWDEQAVNNYRAACIVCGAWKEEK